MAKEGIDSFLLDCHTNENISEIEAAYGIKGFAVIVRLWQKIYSEKGYYCEWTEKSPLLFLSTWFGGGSGVELNLINEVVKTALKNGIFDADLYRRYHILTSDGIQTRYFDVVKRRTAVEVIDEYLLVSVDILGGNVCRKSISVDKNLKNVCKNSTSKVKGSEVKESKVSSSAPEPRKPTADQLISEQCFSPDLEAAVKDWVRYKIEKRQGYKETGLRNLLSQIRNKAEEHGESKVITLIHECMSNNWQGIIWDRLRTNKPEPKKNRFNNFHQRDYDFDELEKRLLNS